MRAKSELELHCHCCEKQRKSWTSLGREGQRLGCLCKWCCQGRRERAVCTLPCESLVGFWLKKQTRTKKPGRELQIEKERQPTGTQPYHLWRLLRFALLFCLARVCSRGSLSRRPWQAPRFCAPAAETGQMNRTSQTSNNPSESPPCLGRKNLFQRPL